jgi:hypothetical protein
MAEKKSKTEPVVEDPTSQPINPPDPDLPVAHPGRPTVPANPELRDETEHDKKAKKKK